MLTITYIGNNSIQLQSESIQAMIDNIEDYGSVKIDATINCCAEIFSHTMNIGPVMDTTFFTITSDSIITTPAFFGLIGTGQFDKLMDGVYKFSVKLFKTENTFVFEESCAFIDITYKCKVAAYLDQLLDTTTEDGVCAQNVTLLHYALVNGSNCGCNCVDMCNVFKELAKIIKTPNTQPQGCGC